MRNPFVTGRRTRGAVIAIATVAALAGSALTAPAALAAGVRTAPLGAAASVAPAAVEKVAADLDLTLNKGGYGSAGTLTVKVVPATTVPQISGTLTVTGTDGDPWVAPVVDAGAVFTVPATYQAGLRTLTVTYSGNDHLLGRTRSTSKYIEPVQWTADASLPVLVKGSTRRATVVVHLPAAFPADFADGCDLTVKGNGWSASGQIHGDRGEVSIPAGLAAGTYPVQVQLTNGATGTLNIDPNYRSATLDISRAIPELTPRWGYTTYPDAPGPLTVEVTTSTGASADGGTAVVTGDGFSRSGVVVDGRFTFSLPQLLPGEYPVTLEYLGNGAVLPGENTTPARVTVWKRPTTTTAPDASATYGTAGSLPVRVHAFGIVPTAGGKVTALVEGLGLTLEGVVVGEVADIALPADLPVGTHTVTVHYLGNAYAARSSDTAVVVVSRPTPTITASFPARPYGTPHNGMVTITAPGVDVDGGTVSLTGDGIRLFGHVEDGSVSLTLEDTLPPGLYPVTIEYSGTESVAPGTLTTSVRVDKVAPRITAALPVVVYGTATSTTIAVTAPEASPDGAKITVSGAGFTRYAVVSGGRATVSLPTTLVPGSYPVTISYGGTAYVASASTTATLKVVKATSTTTVAVSPKQTTTTGTPTVTVAVKAPGLTPAGNVTLTIKGNGKTFTKTLALSGGRATLQLGARAAGSYSVVATYADTTSVKGSKGTTTFTVV